MSGPLYTAKLEHEAAQQKATIRRLAAALKRTGAHLVAAVSILREANERQVAPNRVVASNSMFVQMLKDYEAAVDNARATLREAGVES